MTDGERFIKGAAFGLALSILIWAVIALFIWVLVAS